MFHVFLKLLKKSVNIIKEEPLILIHFLIYKMSTVSLLNLLSQNSASSIYESYIALIVIEWIIPVILVQPIVILMARDIIAKKSTQLKMFLNDYYQLIYGFFIVSLFHKPFYIYTIKHIVELNTQLLETDQVPLSIDTSVIIVLLLSLIISFITIFYQSALGVSKQRSLIMNSVIYSISTLKQYKWVTLSLLAYFVLFVVFLSQFIAAFFVAMLP